MESEVVDHWATLKRCDDNNKAIDNKTLKLIKPKYTFGRSQENDLSFADNKLLSTSHCFIEKEESAAGVKAWFVDQSSNGSLINLKRKIHKNKCVLENNDRIFLVYKKNEPEKNIVFRFEYASRKQLAEQTVAYNCSECLIDEFVEEKNLAIEKFLEKRDKEKNESKTEASSSCAQKSKISEEEKEANEPKVKKTRVENSLIEKEEEKQKLEEECVEKKPEQKDEYEETLTCPICTELIHDCVSIQPCLHSFCAGCYSEWLDFSSECPICRVQVHKTSRNHILNNLIDAYLKNHPEKVRPPEVLKQLNSKNKIKNDTFDPKKSENKEEEKDEAEDDFRFLSDEEEINSEEDENQDYEDGEDQDDEEVVQPAGFANNAFNPPIVRPFGPFYPVNIVQYNQPYRFTCRQCAQNKWLNPVAALADFTCAFNQNHVLCQCCLEAMPDRAAEIRREPRLPKQSCSMCFKTYCDLYWGCRKGACKRCLHKLSELIVGNEPLDTLINENKFESQLFTDWMVRQNKTAQEIFTECLDRMRNGIYTAGTAQPLETLDKIVCRICALKLLRELVYQYRRDLPQHDFFNNANPRPDCHWGKECRTQKHSMDHARRYNHICAPSKQTPKN